MPISGLRMSNVIGKGRTGLRARYTDDLEISDVQLTPETGPAFAVRDSTNLELNHEGFPRPLRTPPSYALKPLPEQSSVTAMRIQAHVLSSRRRRMNSRTCCSRVMKQETHAP